MTKKNVATAKPKIPTEMNGMSLKRVSIYAAFCQTPSNTNANIHTVASSLNTIEEGKAGEMPTCQTTDCAISETGTVLLKPAA